MEIKNIIDSFLSTEKIFESLVNFIHSIFDYLIKRTSISLFRISIEKKLKSMANQRI